VSCARQVGLSRAVPGAQGHQPPLPAPHGLAGASIACLLGDELLLQLLHFAPHRLAAVRQIPFAFTALAVASAAARPVPRQATPGHSHGRRPIHSSSRDQPGWGQAGRPSSIRRSLNRSTPAGSGGSWRPAPTWARPPEPEQARAVAFRWGGDPPRSSSMVQPAPLQRTRILHAQASSRPRASRRPPSAGWSRNNSTARAHLLDLSLAARYSGHWRNALIQGPRSAQVTTELPVCLWRIRVSSAPSGLALDQGGDRLAGASSQQAGGNRPARLTTWAVRSLSNRERPTQTPRPISRTNRPGAASRASERGEGLGSARKE